MAKQENEYGVTQAAVPDELTVVDYPEGTKNDPAESQGEKKIGLVDEPSEAPRPEAFAELKQALQLDPQNADGWNNLGALLARGGQIEAARAAYQRALAIQPDHAQARANLARLPAAQH